MPGLSDAQLVGAITAGSGSGSGSGSGAGEGAGGTGSGAGAGSGRCDMVRRLQDALRQDDDVRTAIANAQRAAGGAVIVWNGDWIQSPAESGKGLAGVRQAIMMEVAFAPRECRAEPVRGRVLLSLDDRGGARLVLGSGVWRWTDLLGGRGG